MRTDIEILRNNFFKDSGDRISDTFVDPSRLFYVLFRFYFVMKSLQCFSPCDATLGKL